MKKILCTLLALTMLFASVAFASEDLMQEMDIAFLPKTVGGAWFTRMFSGIELYSEQTGSTCYQSGPSAGDAAAQNRVTPPRQVLGPLASRNRGPAPVASRGNVKGAPVPGYLQRKFNGVAGGLTPIFNAAANPPATPPKSPPEQPPNPRLEPKGPVSKP